MKNSYYQYIIYKLCFVQIFIFENINIYGYELHLDKGKDVILWKFKGHYLYTQKIEDLDGIFSSSINGHHFILPEKNDDVVGIWLTKYTPKRDNKFVLTYTLKHALFTQGWIRFLADPNTFLLVKTNNDRQLGKYWSNGNSWCDAVISIGLQTMIILEIETPNPENYFILDKVILGIFSNVTHLNGRTLNPCLIHPQPIIIHNTTTSSDNIIKTIISNGEQQMNGSDEFPSNSKITITNTTTIKNNKIIKNEISVNTGGVNERRNVRHSSLRTNMEENSSMNSTSHTSTSDDIELRYNMSSETKQIVDTKLGDDEKWSTTEALENDQDVMRMTLKTPKKRVRLHLTNPTNTTLMDNMDVELPVSDGFITSSSNSSPYSNNHKTLLPLDLKCECSCSCKKP